MKIKFGKSGHSKEESEKMIKKYEDSKYIILNKNLRTRILDLEELGTKIAKEKADGKNHRVEVFVTIWKNYIFDGIYRTYKWATLYVDNNRERGESPLGDLGRTITFSNFTVHAPPKR